MKCTERMTGASLWAALFVLAISCLFSSGAFAQDEPHVILVTFDGLRWQEMFGGLDERFLSKEADAVENIPALRKRFNNGSPEEKRETLLPFIWGTVAKQGVILGDATKDCRVACSNGRLFSYPGYNELLSGSADDSRIASNAKRPNPNVTVLEWLHAKPGFDGKIAAFASWDVFPFIINTERSGIPVNAGWMEIDPALAPTQAEYLNWMTRELPHYWEGIRFDIVTHAAALDYLKTTKPRVMYVAYGETDDWAHDRRYDMYIDAAHRTDAYIRELWEAAQSMPEFAGNTSLVITTDHGRGDTLDDWHGHGADVVGAEAIWAAAIGPQTRALGNAKGVQATQSQIAATVAALAGHDFVAGNPEAAGPIEAFISKR